MGGAYRILYVFQTYTRTLQIRCTLYFNLSLILLKKISVLFNLQNNTTRHTCIPMNILTAVLIYSVMFNTAGAYMGEYVLYIQKMIQKLPAVRIHQ